MSHVIASRRRTLAIVVGVGLAGCLGNDEPEGGFDTDGDFELPTDPDDAAFVDRTGRDTIDIETIQRTEHDPPFVFDPPFVRVDQDTTVRWVNTDGVFHTVTATESLENRTPSGSFDATIASEGDTFEWVAEGRGRQHYYCAPHVGFMFGTIDVV